jgi:hypothetical protein
VWLLVCASGALAGFLYIGLPFPRGHVFLVLLMTLYWALGTLTLVRFFASKWRLAILAVLVFATFVGEFRIVSPMFTKRAKYNILPQVFTPASTVHNVNWPVMKSYFIEYIHTALELNIQNPLDRDELLEGILEKAPKCGYRYLILDYYTASSIKSELLERMALAIPPHAVLFNDYGEDYHTFMDARGYPPSHSMFSDKIVVWDLARIRQPVPEFPPYTTPEDMESRFLAWFSEAKRQQIRAATAATDSDEPASPSKETGTTPEAVPNIGKEPR